MITFENQLPRPKSKFTISDMGEGVFFEYKGTVFQLLYWKKDEEGQTYWHCMEFGSRAITDFYHDIPVIPINVTIIANSYCEKE